MKKNSPTAAGPADNTVKLDVRIDAINQSFALFRRNYHNQYYKAFPDEKELNVTKRLWLDSTQSFKPETILKAARSVIESSEFLPTLHTMLKHCKLLSNDGLPESHQAYIEACQAPSPKSTHAWSHLAVYYAGKETGWYFLLNNPETRAFAVFKEKYEQVCARVNAGEKLPTPVLPALPSETHTPASQEENTQKISDLRKALDF